MQTLFSIDADLPQGFSYTPDFVSVEEEAELLKLISQFELHAFQFHGYEGKRKVVSFGYDWSFEKRTLSKGKEIPKEFGWLIQRTAHYLNINESDFAELLITEYPVGSVINWHRDAPPFEIIAGISLLSDCDFRLRPHDKKRQGKKFIRSLKIAPRSLYIIKDAARSEWEHSTKAVERVRYSITLRTMRKPFE